MAERDYWPGDESKGEDTAEITRRLVASAGRRGMTRYELCPGCGEDGKWHWHPPGTARGWRCDCGAVVLNMNHPKNHLSASPEPTKED